MDKKVTAIAKNTIKMGAIKHLNTRLVTGK